MSLLRTSTATFGVVRSAVAARAFSTTFMRKTADPNILNKDTHSGASVKADKHGKDPHTLQKETADAANSSSDSNSGSKVTASPNDKPTQSEDAVHAEKDTKTPEQLQKETTQKLNS